MTFEVDLANLDERQSQIAIRPGLQASVELHTVEKTLLQYLTKPPCRSCEALHEPEGRGVETHPTASHVHSRQNLKYHFGAVAVQEDIRARMLLEHRCLLRENLDCS